MSNLTKDFILDLLTPRHKDAHTITRAICTSDEINGIEYQDWCVECDNWLEFTKQYEK